MAPLLPVQSNETCDFVIRALAGGKCVALPTDSTYEIVASALCSDAVAILAAEQQPAFVLGDYPNLHDWLPLLRGAGQRLFRKLGAGPIVLQADGGFQYGLWSRLPEASRNLLVKNGQIAVRWPTFVLPGVNVPLVSIPVGQGTTVEQTAAAVGTRVACVVDAGPTQFGAAPTLVQAEGRRCRVIRAGVLTGGDIEELALCRIVFICTGNTCRSPMAESLCTKLLADALGCSPDQLRERGFAVQSAGLAAMPGYEASPDAVRVVTDLGADLSQHRSRPATLELLALADFVFCMTASHAYALQAVPHIPPPRLLSPAGDDIADPIGSAFEDYRTCAEQIIQCLKERLPELLES
jgi:protein-tyrosine phosphatase